MTKIINKDRKELNCQKEEQNEERRWNKEQNGWKFELDQNDEPTRVRTDNNRIQNNKKQKKIIKLLKELLNKDIN